MLLFVWAPIIVYRAKDKARRCGAYARSGPYQNNLPTISSFINRLAEVISALFMDFAGYARERATAISAVGEPSPSTHNEQQETTPLDQILELFHSYPSSTPQGAANETQAGESHRNVENPTEPKNIAKNSPKRNLGSVAQIPNLYRDPNADPREGTSMMVTRFHDISPLYLTKIHYRISMDYPRFDRAKRTLVIVLSNRLPGKKALKAMLGALYYALKLKREFRRT